MDYAAARHNMVEGQIRPNNVTDHLVIDAMAAIPRELFVPKAMRGIAYVDEDLDIGNGRCVMDPTVFARLLQAAEIEKTDVVLDIGCGTGYSTAVLSKIASTVVALEPDADFNAQASKTLSDLGIDNVAVISGDLAQGSPDQGPFNIIFLNGAVEEVPQALLQQLVEGGRLMAVLTKGRFGVASVYTRSGNAFGHRPLFDANVPNLPGFSKPVEFAF